MNSGIQVTTSFMPLAFILNFCTPVIEINGEKNARKWGTHTFDLAPGEYDIKIYFPYLFMPQCGANSIKVKVEEAKVTKIDYNMPPLMIAKGTIKVLN
jgi:hypothetical protein